MWKINNKWFTLVELVVVVIILAILSSIWFVSYSSYLVWVRDTNRISNIKAISDWLELYRSKYSLPLPDDYVEVKSNWNVIAYQWYVWKNVLNNIEFSNQWKDPKFGTYYSYYLTKDRKFFQLMWYLENGWTLQASAFNIANATNIDYSSLFPLLYWDKLWILTDENNIPIQEISSIKSVWKIVLDWTNSWTIYSAHISNDRSYTFSWSILSDKLYTLSKPWKYWPPKDCPIWFVPAWWDSAFNQEWFCVAKYEMWYEDESWAVWTNYDTAEFNAYKYDPSKKITSKPWRYPIVELTYLDAKKACEWMWKWYHLLTLDERMSISRQMEFEGVNYNNWVAWVNSYINKNWVVWDAYPYSNPSTFWCNNSTWWNTEARAEATKSWPWNNSCDSLRQLTMFNWEVLWDYAWNVWEIVDNINNTPQIVWSNAMEWSSVSSVVDKSNYGPLFLKDWLNWIWWLYYPSSSTSWDRDLYLWGSSRDAWYVWIYSTDFSNGVSFLDQNVWFRCAYKN